MASGTLLKRTAPIGRPVEDPEFASTILSGEGSPSLGSANASLHLAVFTDYRCPACRRSAPALEKAIQEDGDVRLIYKDWPIFGDASRKTATVALASARQGIYVAVHRSLMKAPRLNRSALRQSIEHVGGSWSRLREDLTMHADEIGSRLSDNATQARLLGLPGTPGFLAEQIVSVGAIDAWDLRRLFKRAREEPAKALPFTTARVTCRTLSPAARPRSVGMDAL